MHIAYLLSWLDRFLRNRDLILRKLVDIRNKDDHLEIEYKDRLMTGYGDETLMKAFDAIPDDRKDQPIAIAVFNTTENFKELTANWNVLIDCPRLIIYFVNEESLLDKQWVIMPAMHNKIADPDSLKRGLKSMFNAVDALTPSRIKRVINAA